MPLSKRSSSDFAGVVSTVMWFSFMVPLSGKGVSYVKRVGALSPSPPLREESEWPVGDLFGVQLHGEISGQPLQDAAEGVPAVGLDVMCPEREGPAEWAAIGHQNSNPLAWKTISSYVRNPICPSPKQLPANIVMAWPMTVWDTRLSRGVVAV